ncbi:MAG: NTP/NDP exchange transporter, partial [Candidatus Binatia bacterium]
GGILGSTVTATLAQVGPSYLLLGSAALLEVAVFSVRRLSRLSETLQLRRAARDEEKAIGGNALAGLTHVFKSVYLLNVSAYVLLFTITSTFLYFPQAEIARGSFADRAARTAFFAQIDLLVNALTLVTQIFLTSHILRALGVAIALVLLPVLSVLGFATLALAPTIAILVTYQVLRRAGNFAVARPTREVLFTVVPREDKYKAKSFIDTFVYRAGDQVGAWSYGLLSFLGLGMSGIAIVAVPVSVIWMANAWWLGRKQESAERQPLSEPVSSK